MKFKPNLIGIGASIILLLLLINGKAFSQASPVTSGGEISGANGSISYSIGQVFYQSHEGVVNEGNIQPYEIFKVTDIDEHLWNGSIETYPNPTTNDLFIKVDRTKIKSGEAVLYDIKGNIINRKELTSDEILLDMERLTPSVYMLCIYINKEKAKTYKIVKN